MKMILALLIPASCSAQYQQGNASQPNPGELACARADEVPGGPYCGPTLGAYDAAKLPIHIEPPPTSAPAGTVSVTKLRHKPKKGALRAIAEGSKLFDAGFHEQAATQFKKAIAADPEFGLAHDWLGVEYTVLRSFDQARKEFELSIALDPNAWSGHYDFAVLLSRTGDLVGAERSARRALALSSSNPHVHLLLGLLLWQRAETRAEGLEDLELAARTLPQAKDVLSNLQRK